MAPNSRSRRFTTPTEKYDPYRNFNFVIKLDDEVVAACRKMSGLMASVEAVRFRAGNSDSSGDEVLPGRVSYEPVTLESGLTDNPTFQRWANALIQHSHDTQKNTVGDPSLRREVEIEVRDIDNKTIARRFTLHRAWVSKYTALSDLAGDQNGRIPNLSIHTNLFVSGFQI